MLLTGQFVANVDTAIVNIAAPDIHTDMTTYPASALTAAELVLRDLSEVSAAVVGG